VFLKSSILEIREGFKESRQDKLTTERGAGYMHCLYLHTEKKGGGLENMLEYHSF